VEKLREQLAANDKPIALLIGAGASSAVRDPDGEPLVPAIALLTERCAEVIHVMGEPFASAYATIEAEVRTAGPLNVEEILSSVRRKRAAIGEGDHLAGLDRSQLGEIERTIQSTIAAAALPAEDRIPAVLPHHALARWLSRADREHRVCPMKCVWSW
jgi:hypothetical protein